MKLNINSDMQTEIVFNEATKIDLVIEKFLKTLEEIIKVILIILMRKCN